MIANPTPEQAVLGAVIIRPSAFLEASGLVKADDFEKSADRAVWVAMESIATRGGAIDVITLEDALAHAGEALPLDGGLGYLMDLAGCVAHAEHVKHHAEIVARNSAVRTARLLASRFAEKLDSDPEEAQRLLLQTQRLTSQVQRGRTKQGVDLSELIGPMVEEVEARAKTYGKSERLAGMSTGVPGLDSITHGLRPGTLNIIAARTSLGKTAFACQMAIVGAVQHGVPCLFFSLEMRPMELTERFFARLAHISSDDIRTGRLDLSAWKRFQGAGQAMSNPGMLTISNARGIGEISTEARAFRVRNQDKPILIVVDYLQLVRCGQRGRSREQEVAEVSTALKELAVELDCPVVSPVQFNRGPEGEDREPQITDIRESGSIENDADLIVFIVRKRGEVTGPVRLVIAKHRNGALGETEAEWNGPTYEIRDAY